MALLDTLHTETRICRLCGRLLPLIQFYTFKRGGKQKGQICRRTECCDCHRFKMETWYRKNKYKIAKKRRLERQRRNEDRLVVIAYCPECGTAFKVTKPWHKFCCERCRGKFNQRRYRDGKRAKSA